MILYLSCEAEDDPLADGIETLARQVGFDVFRHAPRLETAAYRATTLEKLQEASVVLVLWTRLSAASPWVIDEADFASAQDKLINVEAGAQASFGASRSIAVKLKKRQGVFDPSKTPDLRYHLELAATKLGLKPANPFDWHRWYALVFDYVWRFVMATQVPDMASPYKQDFWPVAVLAFLVCWAIGGIFEGFAGIFWGREAILQRVACRVLGELCGVAVVNVFVAWVLWRYTFAFIGTRFCVLLIAYMLVYAVFRLLPFVIFKPLRQRRFGT